MEWNPGLSTEGEEAVPAGPWTQKALHASLLYPASTPTSLRMLSFMPAGPTCVSIQACIIPTLRLKAVKEPPQRPGAEAQSEGPMWEFSSARDVRFAQLILKAQLCGGSAVHCSQPPANVFALEPRPGGGSR